MFIVGQIRRAFINTQCDTSRAVQKDLPNTVCIIETAQQVVGRVNNPQLNKIPDSKCSSIDDQIGIICGQDFLPLNSWLISRVLNNQFKWLGDSLLVNRYSLIEVNRIPFEILQKTGRSEHRHSSPGNYPVLKGILNSIDPIYENIMVEVLGDFRVASDPDESEVLLKNRETIFYSFYCCLFGESLIKHSLNRVDSSINSLLMLFGGNFLWNNVALIEVRLNALCLSELF